jgi:hypothetical protein
VTDAALFSVAILSCFENSWNNYNLLPALIGVQHQWRRYHPYCQKYADRQDGTARFRRVGSPTNQELTRLTQIIARRVGRFLEGQGLLERDAENSYLVTDALPGGSMDQLLGHSITYRIAVGPQSGGKVFTLQTLPACDPEEQYSDTAGKIAGFSLHAGVAARSDERKKLERLCRYISRPAVSEKWLSLTSSGNIRYQLKTPCRDGTTHRT